MVSDRSSHGSERGGLSESRSSEEGRSSTIPFRRERLPRWNQRGRLREADRNQSGGRSDLPANGNDENMRLPEARLQMVPGQDANQAVDPPCQYRKHQKFLSMPMDLATRRTLRNKN